MIVSGVTDGSYSPYYIMGTTTHTIANGEDGWVTSFGTVRGVDTRGQNGETWNDGDILYGDPNRAGGLTKVKPNTPNNTNSMVIVLKGGSNGTLFVRPGFSPNLVEMITGATNGQVVTYNSSTGIYEGGDSNNIYNNDGSLTGNRVVDLNGNDLTFLGEGSDLTLVEIN